jgi:hypothetical protein
VGRYGTIAAVEFGPLKLKEVQRLMIEKKWGRRSINKQIQRVCAIFKWALPDEV